MCRRVVIFALALALISVILIAEAQRIVGGYSEVKPNEYKKIQNKLQSANLQSALGIKSSCVTVAEIISAEQQVVAGMNYKIVADIDINGQSKKYCFLLYQSLPPIKLTVQCAAKLCGATCKCFKDQ